MNRITAILTATAILVFFLGSCKKPNDTKDTGTAIIAYPDAGSYGNNILSDKISSVLAGKEYSMVADVPQGASLKIILKDEMWFCGSPVNWNLTEYNDDMQSQQFIVLTGEKTADLSIEFGDKVPSINSKTYVTVEYYENGAATPTKVRKLELNYP